MQDFAFASPTPFPTSENISRAREINVARAVVDRRQSTSTVPRKRRRHDGLTTGKRAPLEW